MSKGKKYYAIKIGNQVSDLIVETWEECQKLVIGYPSIYKSFKTQKEAQNYLDSISLEETDRLLLRNRKIKNLKKRNLI